MSGIVFTRHALAACSLSGVALTAIGSFYLAYELLGGRHGPLRTLSGVITYVILFVPCYWMALGPRFGIVAGCGLGVALGLEYWRVNEVDRHDARRMRRRGALYGVLRGLVLGLAATYAYGWRFGVWFAGLTSVALLAVSHLDSAPTQVDAPRRHLRVTLRALGAAGLRALAMLLAGAVAGLLSRDPNRALSFGMRIGATAGIVSVLLGALSPTVEWWTDHLPPRVLGGIGACLLLFGFALGAVEYVAVLCDWTAP